MAGDEEFDPEHPKADEFMAKNRAQKIFTLLLGPIMNIILALLLIAVINMVGVEIDAYKQEKPVIGYIVKNSPADQAGFLPGDILLAINDRKTVNWKQVEITIGTNPKESVKIDFLRQGKSLTTKLNVTTSSRYEIGYAGFYWQLPAEINQIVKNYPAWKAGLKSGDVITAVNEQPVTNYFELADIIHQSPGKLLRLTYKRGERILFCQLTPVNENGLGLIGFDVKIATSKIRYGLLAAIKNSFQEAGQLTFVLFNTFKKMIQRKI